MNSTALTIGALARRAGVNVETIRYYQRLKLLALPALPLGGIRRYPAETAQRVRFIKRAQQLGFTLKEVAGLLALAEGKECSASCGLAECKLWEIERKIADLKSIHAALGSLARECRKTGPGNACPIIEALTGG